MIVFRKRKSQEDLFTDRTKQTKASGPLSSVEGVLTDDLAESTSTTTPTIDNQLLVPLFEQTSSSDLNMAEFVSTPLNPVSEEGPSQDTSASEEWNLEQNNDAVPQSGEVKTFENAMRTLTIGEDNVGEPQTPPLPSPQTPPPQPIAANKEEAKDVPDESQMVRLCASTLVQPQRVDSHQAVLIRWNRKEHFDHTVGLEAWKKFHELRSASSRRCLLGDLLAMDSHLLNVSLYRFVEHCSSDKITMHKNNLFYLILGLQHYLTINGRADNIFFDKPFQEFRELFTNVVTASSTLKDTYVLYIREVHLWETRQLGHFSREALLFTMVYFNTKLFRVFNVESHMQLSARLVENYWQQYEAKLNDKNAPEDPELQTQRKDIAMLYHIYFAKCTPDSLHLNTCFYRMPIPDAPPNVELQYSKEPITEKMLHQMLIRVKMVQEANYCNAIKLLTHNEVYMEEVSD